MISIANSPLAIHEHTMVPHPLKFAEVENSFTWAEVGEDCVFIRIRIVHCECVGWNLHCVVGRSKLAILTWKFVTEGILGIRMLHPLYLREVRP